jgi:hypothetical protein
LNNLAKVSSFFMASRLRGEESFETGGSRRSVEISSFQVTGLPSKNGLLPGFSEPPWDFAGAVPPVSSLIVTDTLPRVVELKVNHEGDELKK